MKGLHPLVATVLLISITLVAISIALRVGDPLMTRSEEILVFQDAKNNILTLDTAINDVVVQGEGAKRAIKLSAVGGNYVFDDGTDQIKFEMDSASQIYAEGLSNFTDNINITGLSGEILMVKSYDKIDIMNEIAFGTGNWDVILTNEGYNSVLGKTELSVTVS